MSFMLSACISLALWSFPIRFDKNFPIERVRSCYFAGNDCNFMNVPHCYLLQPQFTGCAILTNHPSTTCITATKKGFFFKSI